MLFHIRVGRAALISGPYVDRDGKAMLDGGSTLALEGGKRWKGPGHNSIFVQDDTYWLVYHAYDAQATGTPKLRIEALGWDEQGWPVAPSASAQ